MTSVVKLQKKGQLTIPNQMREEIGLAEGDYIHVATRRGKIILERAPVSRTAAEELTTTQKLKLDARLAAGLADVKAGRMHGPFAGPDAIVQFLHDEVRKAGPRAKSKSKPQ